jgi:hypothetical protein
MSNGDIVPEVITTLLNLSKIGLMANEGSRHLIRAEYCSYGNRRSTCIKWKKGFGTVALSVSNGSRISKKPEYNV